MKKLYQYLESHKAWSRGYLQYKYWACVIKYLYIDIDIDNCEDESKVIIKQLFNKALYQNIFYIKKIDFRYYYKYKSINEKPIDIFTVDFI